MAESLKDNEKPFKVFCIFEGVKTLHSGHLTKELAEGKAKLANDASIELKLKSKSIVAE